MSNSMIPSSVVTWTLGGAACKINSVLRDELKKLAGRTGSVPIFDSVFIDTSATEASYVPSDAVINIVRRNGSSKTGSGGDRSLNYEAAQNSIPGYVDQNFDPDAINFVLFSTGGGSGATLAFVLVKELLARNAPIVLFISNSTNSLARTINATTALSSLESLAIKNGVAIPTANYDTTTSETFTDNDVKLSTDMIHTAMMLSNSNVSVDDMDRMYLLNPCALPRSFVEPGLKALDILDASEYTGNHQIASVLTLSEPGVNDDIGTGSSHIYGGVLTTGLKTLFSTDDTDSPVAISLLLVEDVLQTWVESLNVKIANFKRTRQATPRPKKIVLDSSIDMNTADDDGFIC